MKRSRIPSPRTIPILLLSAALVLSPGLSESAVLEQYCQYPPYVLQTVLPSVTLLVSNSQSMGKFAYGDPSRTCATGADACGGFNPGTRYFGIFDSDSYYRNPGGTQTSGERFSLAGIKGKYNKGKDDWDGNFLNWLTMRRIDVMKKVLTGGDGKGSQACSNVTEAYKTFFDDGYIYSSFNTGNQTVYFPISSSCAGAATAVFHDPNTDKYFRVEIVSPGSTSGILQEVIPKASVGLAFYNESDSEGGRLDPAIDGTNLGLSAYRNRIDTPSRFNGMTYGQPLGEALWTIVGQYARDATVSSTGPRYHSAIAQGYNPGSDAYYFNGAPSRCIKGSVIIISDGEPCNDGHLPTSYASFNIKNYADNTAFNCLDNNCLAALDLPATAIPACAAGGNVGGLEDVALFAHTQDLRSKPTFGVDNLAGRQNLDIYVIRAFGRDNSSLLKYAAINGSFDDANGNGRPDPGEYAYPGTAGSSYFEAENGTAIAQALREIFVNILRRATSGTAASVLASGEGSGANLLQAVFYPRRRFFDEVIEWSGTLQNLWYYVDPFFTGASIREDSDRSSVNTYNPVLNLVTDNTIVYFFDTASQTTKVNRYRNDSNGNAYGTPNVIPFEEVKSIWESGYFLHAAAPGTRRIFTAVDNTGIPRTQLDFVTGNASTLRSYMGAGSDAEAAAVIQYVRGTDDPSLRQRTVPYPTSTDNTVWKLGDIINSTPKVVSRVALNTYDKTYGDTTYKKFIASPTYMNRGMVFVGANDGMLHAFKLGKLQFPGDSGWPISDPPNKDRARLYNDNISVPLGSERWAFIPKNALPYLKAIPDNNYCHLYYVDLSPHLVDASIGQPPTFVADNVLRDVNSWRTILIGGMRYGGACRDNTVTCYPNNSANCVSSPVAGNGLSSYFAIDVTDPEDPKVLWEFSHPALGFTTTGPAVVRINARTASGFPDSSRNGKWFVVFGSGPTGPISGRQFLGRSDQTLKLFVLDLKTGQLLRTIEQDADGATISNAFAGSMLGSTADFDLDYQDDALYVGYVKQNTSFTTSEWNQGGVLRLQTKGDLDPANWATSRLIDGIGPVTSSVARLQNNSYHTNWIFFGTGRYYYSARIDNNVVINPDDATTQRNIFGVKDPCFTDQNVLDPACKTTVNAADLQAVGDTTVIDESFANSSGFHGWKILLDTNTPFDYDGTGVSVTYEAERVITDPLATRTGVVFFTTFRPYGDVCSIGGRTFLWAVRYNTGGVPPYALQGRALMQVSTASVEQLDLGAAFSQTPSGVNPVALHRGGRRSFALEGVPPTAQGLSLLFSPPALKRILHMKER